MNKSRKIDYLRISVTDRCNLRCMYCLPAEGISCRPREEMLTFEEIIRLGTLLVTLGISKIRLTGGEPLVRRGVEGLVKSLTKIKGIEEVTLTTNGVLLSSFAGELKKSGLKRVNVSLDTLCADKFQRITRFDKFRQVMEGIAAAGKTGLHPLKLNVVAMRGVNEDEIIDFVEFALKKNIVLRFIEFMNITPLWHKKYFFPIDEVKKICQERFKLIPLGASGPGPAFYYEVEKVGKVGFINTQEDNCRLCNRLRLTSSGELKICLYESTPGPCLRTLLRKGVSGEGIKEIIREKLSGKEDLDHRDGKDSRLYMCKVGG